MKSILVIEDEEILSENIATALTLNKYEVITADNGEKGYELALEIHPDLILCDIMLPIHDGYWVLENIRKMKNLRSVPFIFITARVEREDLRKGMNLGADDYLTKPFKISELLEVIEIRLAKHAVDKPEFANNNVSIKKTEDNFLMINTGKSIEKVQISSIECIIADNVFTQIILTNKKSVIVRKTLSKWEALLPEHLFLRIHRSAIVNLNHVRLIEKWYNQTMMIHMQNYDKPIIMSRGYTSKLKGKFII